MFSNTDGDVDLTSPKKKKKRKKLPSQITQTTERICGSLLLRYNKTASSIVCRLLLATDVSF